jgi:hypothetical protein
MRSAEKDSARQRNHGINEHGGEEMARYSVDCRHMPSESNCDIKISGSEEHLVEAAAVHMITHHQHADPPELREEIRKTMKTEADD